MSLLEKFIYNLKRNNLFSSKDKLLLAVSGGVDSVVLCELCKQAGFDFSIAHCNFQLRGEESDRDETFVRNMAKNYQVEFFLKKFDTETYALKNRISLQEAARDLRYSWFDELIRDSRLTTHASRLLTAHHADDNIETLLMNFFRGTGLHGLTAISAIKNYIRRPLLEFLKEQLIDFAGKCQLAFVEDSSNLSSKYTRNYFRNELIPAISQVYPQVKQNLVDNIHRFREIEKLYQLGVSEIKKKLCKQKGNEIHIPIKQLMKVNNSALIYEIISPFGFSEKQVEELLKLANSDSGKYLQSPANTYRIIRHRHWFIISPVNPVEAENIIIEEGITNLQFAIGNLQLKILPIASCQPESYRVPSRSISGDSLTAYLDLRRVTFPLLLRKWKQGDYFYPLGMKKKKKLSRFFIDQKLSKTEKEKAWVLESSRRIIWVIGHRIDDRFKLEAGTTDTIELCLVPS